MTIALLSLLGMPPLAGFISKLLIFFSAIYAGLMWLAFIGVINSAISIFYYIRVVKLMIFDNPKHEQLDSQFVDIESVKPYKIPFSYGLAITLGVLLIIIVGIFPGFIFDLAVNAVQDIFAAL
jgi:NADH-quinone oxidoreductase subunit N